MQILHAKTPDRHWSERFEQNCHINPETGQREAILHMIEKSCRTLKKAEFKQGRILAAIENA